jgi:hypothetical protein
MVFAVHEALGRVMAAEFYIGYVCPGFYPVAARDLDHAASLFALWKARRKFGPCASCVQLTLQEKLVNGAKFQVRLIGQKGVPGETYRFTVMVDGA